LLLATDLGAHIITVLRVVVDPPDIPFGEKALLQSVGIWTSASAARSASLLLRPRPAARQALDTLEKVRRRN
jgi:hypothetical protein